MGAAAPAGRRRQYYPEDRAALLELPERVEHYDVLDAQLKA